MITKKSIAKPYKKALKYASIIFIILLFIEVIAVYNGINDYKLSTYNQKKSYLNVIISDTKNTSDLIFENIINTPEVISIFKNASSSDIIKKDMARKKLYSLLVNKYNTFKKYGIQQLHFHLTNNESFLRFHKPSKYGDNLTNIRVSVMNVNKYKKPTFGFEEGKIFNGYRFVYPLFDSKYNHIGSVEVSQSLLSFKNNYEDSNHEHIDFVLKKSVVDKKVFKDQLKNYVKYMSLNNFLIQKNIYISNKNDIHMNLRNKFLNEIFKDKYLMQSMDKLEKISIVKFDNFQVYNVTFIPLLNDFNKKKVGYSIIISKFPFQKNYIKTHLLNILLLFILSIIIGILLSKKEVLKEYHKKSSQDYQLISDLSNNLIIAVENNALKSVNKKFKVFFDIEENLDESNIKEIFINSIVKKNGYLYLTKQETLYQDIHTSTYKEVVLKNTMGIKSIFEISSHSANFKNNKDFVIELVNITQLKNEVQSLQSKAYTDKLTKISNRLYFDNIFYKELKYMQENRTDLSLIMFDIDYFKKINDQYGHDIGDESLVFLANLVQKNTRKNDTFSRWGGEEFFIITHNSINDSIDMANNLRKAIDNETQRNENIPHFTCSFGVVSLLNISSQKDAIQKVDKLLYKAKNSGRNIVISQ